MAIAFRGSTTGAQTNGGNVTLDLTLISGLAEGDFVIAAFVEPAISDLALEFAVQESGWTRLGDLYANDTQDVNLAVFCKFMGSTPDTSVSFTGTGATSNGNTGIAMAFSGVDKTRPLDVAPTTATGIDTAVTNPPSITPSGAAGVAAVIVGACGHTGGAGQTYTNPTGYTTNAASISANDTNDSLLGMGYNLSPSSPEDPGNMTPSFVDSANFSWAAMTIALRPTESTGIRIVGTAKGNNTNGGDVTLTLPAGTAQNDLVVVVSGVPRNADIDVAMTTSGYTEVADLSSTADNNDINMGVFYKVMGATPDTTAVTNGGADANDGTSAVAIVFRGVDTSTPMDVTATTATGINSGNADPPSINQADANALIVVAAATGHIQGAAGGYIHPTKYIGVDAIGNDTRDSLVGLAYKGSHLSSDPEDPPAFNEVSRGSGVLQTVDLNNSWCAVTMALRKAVATSLQPVLIVVGL